MGRLYIGIDPGVSNGGMVRLAWPELQVEAFKFATATPQDICDALALWAKDATFTMIEEMQGFVFGRGAKTKTGDDVKINTGKLATLHAHYGMLLGCLLTIHAQHDVVRPRVWQQKLQCLSRGDKKITKARAQQLFGHVQVTNWNADALLIARYCAIMHEQGGRLD